MHGGGGETRALLCRRWGGDGAREQRCAGGGQTGVALFGGDNGGSGGEKARCGGGGGELREL